MMRISEETPHKKSVVFAASTYPVSVFVLALLPFDCMSVQIRHYQRGRGPIRVGLTVVCWALRLLLSTGSWLQPVGHIRFLLTDCWLQGVKKLSRIKRVPLSVICCRWCDFFMSHLFRRPRSSWLDTDCFARQVGYPGFLANKRVSVFLWQGMFWAMCWGGVGGVSQWADLGLGNREEVLLWLKQSPAQ